MKESAIPRVCLGQGDEAVCGARWEAAEATIHINQLDVREGEDLVVLSVHGYRSVIVFHDSTTVTMTVSKDEEEDDNLEAALNLVETHHTSGRSFR